MQGFTCTYLICLLIKYIDMLFMLFLCEAHVSHEDKCNDKDIIFEKAIELLMQE